jgi:hypothetical protein
MPNHISKGILIPAHNSALLPSLSALGKHWVINSTIVDLDYRHEGLGFNRSISGTSIYVLKSTWKNGFVHAKRAGLPGGVKGNRLDG